MGVYEYMLCAFEDWVALYNGMGGAVGQLRGLRCLRGAAGV